MYRQLLFIGALYLTFATTTAIQCYAGTDNQCTLAPDTNNCGHKETCMCVKYRFKCSPDDTACNKQEQISGTTKWAYTIVSKTVCNAMKNSMNVFYSDVTCCSKNRCNTPNNGKCTQSFAHRRSLKTIS